jgi:uncharacterized protein (TIGR03066 family)
MHLSRFFMATLVVLSLTLVGTAGSDKAKKLLGVWEVVKSESAPPGATVEFTADSKLKLRAKVDGKELKIDGTYELKGDDIISTLTFAGQTKKETNTIKNLTDKKLVIEDDKGKVEEYKRLK